MSKKTPPGSKAWLVTWEWCGDHAKRESPVAAIFKPQWSATRVQEFVEFIYLSEYSLSERLAYAINPKKNPYRARLGDLEGLPWLGEIICGHNPWLRARLVDGLSIDRDEQGKETVVWNERPKPDISWMKNKVIA